MKPSCCHLRCALPGVFRCSSLIDPMLVVFYATLWANLAVLVTCLSVWMILFMNVSLQFFVTAEAAYHALSSYTLHTIVTLSVLPTVLLFWTFVTWYIMSRLIEWINLVWSTPRFSSAKRYDLINTGDSQVYPVEQQDDLEQVEGMELTNLYNESTTTDPVPQDDKRIKITDISKSFASAVEADLEASRLEKQRQDISIAVSRAADDAEAMAESVDIRFDKLQLTLNEQERLLLPSSAHVDSLVERTKKRASRIRKALRPPFLCTWSDYMLETPFNFDLTQVPYGIVLVVCIVVELVTLAACYGAGALNGFPATVLMTVLTGVLLMLWAILNAAENCSRAFWYQWCYFAGCAVLTAFLCLAPSGDWSNQFVSTAVIVYVAVMLLLTGLLVMYSVWLAPLHDFWMSTELGKMLYIPGMGAFWVGLVAFLAAFLTYEFREDRGGVYCRIVFQLCWVAPSLLLLGKTFCMPHSMRPEQETRSAYGAMQRGDWTFQARLVAVGYVSMFMGVFGGAWAGGNNGILSVLCYLAGPFVLVTFSVAVLLLMSLCGRKRLRAAGWSFMDTTKGCFVDGAFIGVGKAMTYVLTEKAAALWAWDMFRVFAAVVLLAILAVSVYTKLSAILLFLFLAVLHGYVLVEHHFFSPIRTTIALGGVTVATLHSPRRRLYVLLLGLLFFCDVLIMGVATWSLTTTYTARSATQSVRKEELYIPGTVARYGICYEQTFHTLDVIDLAFLTELTYFHDPVDGFADCGRSDPGNLQICLDHYFSVNYTKGQTNNMPYAWEVMDISVPLESKESSQPAYYGIRSAAANLLVVGVRGSTTGRDWLEDFNLYSEASLLQFFSLVVPITYVWPHEATAAMVKAFAFTQKVLFVSEPVRISKDFYYKPVQDYAEKLQSQNPGYELMLVGHSLGGATAQIAAARMGVRGFGFEPPGTIFSHDKFGIPHSKKRLDDTLVTVMRDNDPVVYVDAHAGQTQQLVCPSSFLTAYCHAMHPIICHLMANCDAMDRVTFDYWGGGQAFCGATEPSR